jgi:hypothetical protein
MHAVFITYTTSVDREHLREPYTQYAQTLADGRIPGFVAKTWLVNGDTHGGFHLFRDREAADRYLAEMFEPTIPANPAFSNIRIERFDVAEELSSLTHGLAAMADPAP